MTSSPCPLITIILGRNGREAICQDADLYALLSKKEEAIDHLAAHLDVESGVLCTSNRYVPNPVFSFMIKKASGA